MYAIYDNRREGLGYRFKFKEKTNLLGSKNGEVPYLVKKGLAEPHTNNWFRFKKSTAARQECFWHVDLQRRFEWDGYRGSTLVIDLKPKSAKPNLSLYELVEAWGHSNGEWTPVMFYLAGLFIDADPAAVDRSNFVRQDHEIDRPIFTILYVHGTIKDCAIHGKWTTSGKSARNSVLLWPRTLTYFFDEAQEVIKKVCGTRFDPVRDRNLGSKNSSPT